MGRKRPGGRKRSIEPLQRLWQKASDADCPDLCAETIEQITGLCAKSLERFAFWWLEHAVEALPDRTTYAEVLTAFLDQWRTNRRYILASRLARLRRTLAESQAMLPDSQREQISRLMDQESLLVQAFYSLSRPEDD